MSGDKVYLYHRSNQNDSLPHRQYDVELVNVDADAAAREESAAWTGGDDNLLPVLRFGEDAIYATVFNPGRELFSRLLGNTTIAARSLPRAVVYSGSKCDNCERLKYWLTRHNIAFDEINVDTDVAALDRIRQWSGGRRVIPSIEFPGTARLFNPPLEMLERLVGAG